jgi:hypothetical protein
MPLSNSAKMLREFSAAKTASFTSLAARPGGKEYIVDSFGSLLAVIRTPFSKPGRSNAI